MKALEASIVSFGWPRDLEWQAWERGGRLGSGGASSLSSLSPSLPLALSRSLPLSPFLVPLYRRFNLVGRWRDMNEPRLR